ncbi:MAG: thiamine-phosphate diphosphorylase [Deferribacteraceae bacterium]|jgi:thiamine-phosphate pyrophosphorylase|nr:thiamine-phosphate diphosphorylase [Deferribacteraceae bacterium]
MCSKYRQEIKKYLKLYLVLETEMLKLPLENFLEEVLAAGVTAIQLRDKNKTANERYYIAQEILKVLKYYDAMFVVNDRLDLALSVGAGCVHLGVKDIPAKVVKLSFPDIIVGYSCNNYEDVKVAEDAGADYIGIGPAFYTGTKNDLRNVIGPGGVISLQSETDLPGVAIGGINLENVKFFKGTNLSGVAVSSAICSAENPGETVKRFLDILYG